MNLLGLVLSDLWNVHISLCWNNIIYHVCYISVFILDFGLMSLYYVIAPRVMFMHLVWSNKTKTHRSRGVPVQLGVFDFIAGGAAPNLYRESDSNTNGEVCSQMILAWLWCHHVSCFRGSSPSSARKYTQEVNICSKVNIEVHSWGPPL